MFYFSGQFAAITAIAEEWYLLERFSSEDEFRGGAHPLESKKIQGEPTVLDCLSALPDGFVYSGGDLPHGPHTPRSVTARQIRLWLVSHGVSLAAVEAAIDAITDAQQREMVRVEWEYAPYVERTHPMLVPLAAALGLSEAQVDQAFREAATI